MAKAAPKHQRELNKLYHSAIREHIEKENIDKLSDLLLTSKEYSVPRSLQAKGWFIVANARQEKKQHGLALIAYSAARSVDPDNEKLWIRMVQSFQQFYLRFEKWFSWSDIIYFSDPIDRLLEYRKINNRAHGTAYHDLKRLKNSLDNHLSRAKQKKETKATHQVMRIYSAFREGMTPKEVNDELMAIMLPTMIEWIKENPSKDSKSKKKPKSNAAPPPPKDPDEPEEPKKGDGEEPKDGDAGKK